MIFDRDSAEKTIDDRIKVLEAKIPAFQERIAAYDKLFDSINDLILKIEMEKEKTDGHRVAIDKLTQTVNQLHNTQAERINKLQSDLIAHADATNVAFRGQEGLKDTLAAMVSDVHAKVDSLGKQSEIALSQKANAGEVDVLNQKISNGLDFCAKAIQEGKRSSESNYSNLKDKIQEVKENGYNVAALESDFLVMSARLSEIKSNLANLRDEVPVRISQLLSQVDDKLMALKSELATKPSEITEFKNDVNKKIEAIALDGDSANIRSSNTDQKVFLLEKKLENLSLLVKKFELSK